MALNIMKLPKSHKFLVLAKDILSGFDYNNSKGEHKNMVHIKSPLSTETELITMSYNADFITTLKIDPKAVGGLRLVNDDEEDYDIIRIGYKEKKGAEKSNYVLTVRKDDEFVPKCELEQEDFFELMGEYENEVVKPYILEKIAEMNKEVKEGDIDGERN